MNLRSAMPTQASLTLLSAMAVCAICAQAHEGHDDSQEPDFPVIGRLAQAGPASAASSATLANQISVTIEGDKRVIRANGIPDHTPGQFPNRNNPNRISAQNYTLQVPTKPTVAGSPVVADRGWFGVAVNGVPFEAGTAEFWSRDWKYEAIGGKMNLGLDQHLAHVQPTGAYHYHGLPKGLLDRLGDDGKKMVLVGWAGDGYPIYSSYGYSDASNAASGVKKLKSSYKLKSGTRPGNPAGPGGTYDGAFTADYEFVRGSGDLDECNGRTGVTPEFPQGTYYYVLTAEFPFVSRLWHGAPDSSFQRKGGADVGPRGPGRGGPPGGPGGGRSSGPRPDRQKSF